jgi:hypothetical protein
MVELDMVHDSYFGGFLGVAVDGVFQQTMLFILCSIKHYTYKPVSKACRPAGSEKPPGLPESLQARLVTAASLASPSYHSAYKRAR